MGARTPKAVVDHLVMMADQIGHWIDVADDITDSQPNVPFAARALMQGAKKNLSAARKGIIDALKNTGDEGRDASVELHRQMGQTKEGTDR